MGENVPEPEVEYVTVHVKLRRDLYEKLWDLTKTKFVIPTKKFHVVINEVIEEYFKNKERHG